MKVRPINFEDLKAALRQVKASVSSQVHKIFFSLKNLILLVEGRAKGTSLFILFAVAQLIVPADNAWSKIKSRVYRRSNHLDTPHPCQPVIRDRLTCNCALRILKSLLFYQRQAEIAEVSTVVKF
jgi:hypothetical protein